MESRMPEEQSDMEGHARMASMEDRKTELIRVKCTPDMLKRIEDEATAQRRDFADMVRLLIVDGLAAQIDTRIIAS